MLLLLASHEPYNKYLKDLQLDFPENISLSVAEFFWTILMYQQNPPHNFERNS